MMNRLRSLMLLYQILRGSKNTRLQSLWKCLGNVCRGRRFYLDPGWKWCPAPIPEPTEPMDIRIRDPHDLKCVAKIINSLDLIVTIESNIPAEARAERKRLMADIRKRLTGQMSALEGADATRAAASDAANRLLKAVEAAT